MPEKGDIVYVRCRPNNPGVIIEVVSKGYYKVRWLHPKKATKYRSGPDKTGPVTYERTLDGCVTGKGHMYAVVDLNSFTQLIEDHERKAEKFREMAEKLVGQV
jgi:hypothetical protein